MVRRQKRKRSTSKKREGSNIFLKIFRFFVKEEKTLYHVCVHPVACWFDKLILLWPMRIWVAIVFGLILASVSAIYPICTQDTCYTVFAQLFLNPELFFRPIAPALIFAPFVITFTFFTLAWFVLLSITAWIEKKQWFHELIFPAVTAILFIYVFLLTSGTLGPFFLHTTLIDCTTDHDCIRAGYVGEVCTSVYKPAYTTYDPDLEPLTECVCRTGTCVGS